MSEWQPARTAPTNGDEFWYISRGKVRVGALASDCGGEIKRDPDMIAWHRKLQWYEPYALAEAPPAMPSDADDLPKHKAHEAECRSAAMAVLKERQKANLR